MTHKMNEIKLKYNSRLDLAVRKIEKKFGDQKIK